MSRETNEARIHRRQYKHISEAGSYQQAKQPEGGTASSTHTGACPTSCWLCSAAPCTEGRLWPTALQLRAAQLTAAPRHGWQHCRRHAATQPALCAVLFRSSSGTRRFTAFCSKAPRTRPHGAQPRATAFFNTKVLQPSLSVCFLNHGSNKRTIHARSGQNTPISFRHRSHTLVFQ